MYIPLSVRPSCWTTRLCTMTSSMWYFPIIKYRSSVSVSRFHRDIYCGRTLGSISLLLSLTAPHQKTDVCLLLFLFRFIIHPRFVHSACCYYFVARFGDGRWWPAGLVSRASRLNQSGDGRNNRPIVCWLPFCFSSWCNTELDRENVGPSSSLCSDTPTLPGCVNAPDTAARAPTRSSFRIVEHPWERR